MDQERAKSFIQKRYNTKYYQPVVLVPGILEIKGKWNSGTKELCNTLFKDIKGKSVLDIGCNVGFFLFEAMKRGAAKAVGFDCDQSLIADAKEIAEICHLDVQFYVEDFQSNEVLEQFDVILVMNILHLSTDIPSFIDRCFSLAKERVIIEHAKEHAVHFQHLVTSNFGGSTVLCRFTVRPACSNMSDFMLSVVSITAAKYRHFCAHPCKNSFNNGIFRH
jgi:2-polyprenyl-3-methyl-5-hydroxy-6-metoxy-1,4-benzoquinol methylase